MKINLTYPFIPNTLLLMLKAIFPGSFDPPTFGHLNIIKRSAVLFDQLSVVIAVNSQKKYIFTHEERFDLLKKLVNQWKNVSVHICETLIVEYARNNNAQVLIRGVRNVGDFSYELDLSMLNKALSPGIETVFLPTDAKYAVLRSSVIKELASFGGDVSAMVPEPVAELLKKKFAK